MRRNKPKVFLLPVAAMMLFVCCSKEEEGRRNAITFGSIEYPVDQGELYDLGSLDERHFYSIELFNSAHKLGYGVSNYAGLEIVALGEDQINAGTFLYDSLQGSGPGTFIATITIGSNLNTGQLFADFTPKSGTLAMAKLGEKYEIVMDVIADRYDAIGNIVTEDVRVTLYYKGPLVLALEVE